MVTMILDIMILLYHSIDIISPSTKLHQTLNLLLNKELNCICASLANVSELACVFCSVIITPLVFSWLMELNLCSHYQLLQLLLYI